VSAPAAPVEVGHYDTTGFSGDVQVVGTLAYVAAGEWGLLIVDVSNSAAPALIGRADMVQTAVRVQVVGTLAYVADYYSDSLSNFHAWLETVDVSNPAEPVELGYCSTTHTAHGLHVVGGRAYVAELSGLGIFDLGPHAVGVSQIDANTFRVHLEGVWTNGWPYTISVGPGIADLAGNTMDQWQDGIGGGPDDAFLLGFKVDLPPVVSVDFLDTYDRTPPLTGHVDDPNAQVLVMVNSVPYWADNLGDGTWVLADNTIEQLDEGRYDVQVAAEDAAGNVGTDTTTGELRIIVPHVVGRYVFYNGSYWDGGDPGANAQDDAAIAPDKQPLLPGQTAEFANYTSYSRGLNGIMIDVSNLPPGVPTAADFEFRAGNDADPAGWPLAAGPATLDVRRGAGVGGSDRVTLIWPEASAVRGQWLRVAVLPGGGVGLAAADVFYFGNAVGEAGDLASDAKVTTLDVSLTRANLIAYPAPPPEITNRYDFNRDHKVNTLDVSLVRSNLTTAMNALKLIAPPATDLVFAGPRGATTSAMATTSAGDGPRRWAGDVLRQAGMVQPDDAAEGGGGTEPWATRLTAEISPRPRTGRPVLIGLDLLAIGK
jgi:hypothetical protein